MDQDREAPLVGFSEKLAGAKHGLEKVDGPEAPEKKIKVELEPVTVLNSGMKGKGKKQKQGVKSETPAAAAANMSTSRWSHKSAGYALTPSLLEEVLNEKKMAMLKSPAVTEHLKRLQDDLRISTAESTQKLASTKIEPEKPSCTAVEIPQDNKPATSKESGTGPPEAGTSDTNARPADIWSRESSAFSSVSSSNLKFS